MRFEHSCHRHGCFCVWERFGNIRVMNKLKEILKNKRLWETLYAFLMVAILITCILPLLRLTKYSVPYYDDYGYTLPVWVAYKWGGFHLKSAVIGSLQNVIRLRYTWQGTYTSIFFMGLCPMIFGEEYYRFGTMFLVLILAVALFVFIHTVTKYCFGAKRRNALGIEAGIAILVFLFVYSAQQAFFWFNGGIHYVGMLSFALLFLSLVIRTLNESRHYLEIVFTVCSTIVAFFIAGGNFITLLQVGIVLVTLFLVALVKRTPTVKRMIPIVVTYFLGFGISVSAPGNAVRAASFTGLGLPPVKAILMSFPTALIFAKKFLDWRTLLVLAMLLPILWSIAGDAVENEKPKFLFSYTLPGFVVLALWSVCFYASCFTPELYAAGGNAVSRSINIMKMVFQLLLVMNMAYALVLVRKYTKANFAISPIVIVICAIPWIMAWNHFFRISPDPIGQYSAFGAKLYLESGQAQQFHAEYEQRIARLKSPGADVVFEPYSIKPWFLIWKDLSDNPNDEPNRFMSNYYGKESVVVKAAE